MSPEQAWGDPVDGRTDVFSAGILLYELLTGQMAYRGESVPALLDRVRKADIPAPTTRRKDIPALLVDIVTRAIQKSPDDRYATAHEFRAALEQFLFTHAPDFTAARLASLVGSILEAGEDSTTEREMARLMVTQYGMSERLGPLTFGNDQRTQFLKGAGFPQERDYSEETARVIDEEARAIVERGLARARGVLGAKKATLLRGAEELKIRETLEGEALRRLLTGEAEAGTRAGHPRGSVGHGGAPAWAAGGARGASSAF
jgi:hypothetical protein